MNSVTVLSEQDKLRLQRERPGTLLLLTLLPILGGFGLAAILIVAPLVWAGYHPLFMPFFLAIFGPTFALFFRPWYDRHCVALFKTLGG